MANDTETGCMGDIELDLDDPHVGEQLERVRNRIYRLFEAEDTPFDAEDFFLLDVANEYLTEEEIMELGKLSLKIEEEGREGLDFPHVTEYERKYGELIKEGIERYKENESIDPGRFPEWLEWSREK